MAEQNPEVLQAEIERLQRQLDETRAAQGVEETAPYEKQEVRSALEERAGEGSGPEGLSAPAPSGSAVTPTPTNEGIPPELAPQVQALVDVAFTKGVDDAVKQARASGNPALVDALHDVLADRLHQELLARRAVAPAP